MRKRCIIIHGWDGYPEEGWFPWLKAELEAKRFTVEVPAMPHPDEPTIDDWVNALSAIVGEPDEQTFLVGHSMGCQTILRYLQTLPEGKIVGGIVLVAPFVRLKPIINDEPGVPEIFEPWLKTPMYWDVIRKRTKRSMCIFSDNDAYVYHEDAPMFTEKIGAQTMVLSGKNHFSGNDNIIELPEARDAVIQFAE